MINILQVAEEEKHKPQPKAFSFKHTRVKDATLACGIPPYERPLYRLDEELSFDTDIIGHEIKHEFYYLSPKGKLTCFPGLIWDGASGGLDAYFDGSLPHDVLCWEIGKGRLPSRYQVQADKVMRRVNQERGGQSAIRAWHSWIWVRTFQSVSRWNQRRKGKIQY